MRIRIAIAIVALGCGDRRQEKPPPPPPPAVIVTPPACRVVDRVIVTLRDSVLRVGETTQATAIALDSAGDTIPLDRVCP